jgi:hypothetical protein
VALQALDIGQPSQVARAQLEPIRQAADGIDLGDRPVVAQRPAPRPCRSVGFWCERMDDPRGRRLADRRAVLDEERVDEIDEFVAALHCGQGPIGGHD